MGCFSRFPYRCILPDEGAEREQGPLFYPLLPNQCLLLLFNRRSAKSGDCDTQSHMMQIIARKTKSNEQVHTFEGVRTLSDGTNITRPVQINRLPLVLLGCVHGNVMLKKL